MTQKKISVSKVFSIIGIYHIAYRILWIIIKKKRKNTVEHIASILNAFVSKSAVAATCQIYVYLTIVPMPLLNGSTVYATIERMRLSG